MAEATKPLTAGLIGRKSRSAMIVVGVILTIICAGLITFTDLTIPLYALILIVGIADVLVAVGGAFVFSEHEELRSLPGGVLEHISRRGIMAALVPGGFLLLFYLTSRDLYDATPAVVFWLLFGIVISALSAIAVAMASEEVR